MGKFLYKISFSFFSLVVFFIFSNFVYAEDSFITQFPDSPREGEEVKLKIESSKYDLNVAKISWVVDGVEVDSGMGRKTLTISASKNGSAQIIMANIEQEGYSGAVLQRVVEANTNFILYEGADSYVPAFYKGRRLPAKEGTVKAAFFSFKDGNIIGLDTSGGDNFSWKINNQDKKEYSGLNKIVNNILTKVTDKILNIQVSKEDTSGNKKITDAVIPLQNTEIQIYKTDQTKMEKNILGDTETGKEIFLMVEPFFFSIGNKASTDLSYTWKINDIENKISTPWFAVFSGKERDSVKINLDVINNKKITQDGSRGFTFKIE
jgi:hypothetical protein